MTEQATKQVDKVRRAWAGNATVALGLIPSCAPCHFRAPVGQTFSGPMCECRWCGSSSRVQVRTED
jgi:hypothetical protein